MPRRPAEEDDDGPPLVPFPRLPPLPPDPGEYLTHFTGFLAKPDLDQDGRLSFKFLVDDVDKYKAMPLTDIRGRDFTLVVYAQHGRTPLVVEHKAMVYSHHQTALEKARARKDARIVKRVFAGEDGPDE